MSVTLLCLTLAVGFALFAVVLNHAYARIALVELTLNEGLPPGHQIAEPGDALASAETVASLLGPGVHIFASRNCHACQRLLEELQTTPIRFDGTLHLHYIDRPRPVAREVAAVLGASLNEQQSELSLQVGADPLPYTIVSGEQGLLSRSVSPTVADIARTARDAGVSSTAELAQ